MKQLSHHLRQRLRAFRHDEGGAVAVLFTLALAAVVGTLAISYEIGKAWTVQTELQNAADASALAGATQLDQETGAIARATALAKSEIVRNSQTFASDGQGAEVALGDDDIRFYETLADVQAGTTTMDDTLARFIEITTDPRRIDFAFSLLNGGPSAASPRGRAVAGSTAAYCKVPPMFVCMPTGGLPAMQPGYGVWLKGKDAGDTSPWGPGNYGLLALNTSDGSTSLSASAIRDALARENPLAECYAEDGTVQTKPGQTTSIREGLNMRFDIYPTGTHQVPQGEPPVMSNWQYRPSANTVKGLWKDGNKCSFSGGGPQGWKKTANVFDGPGEHADLVANPIDAMGYPRDNCAYPLTGANPATTSCEPAAGSGQFGDGQWDADTYVRVNHSGHTPTSILNEVNASGYSDANASSLSRFEMHQWELAQDLVPNVAPSGERADTVDNPVCHAGATYDPSTNDRRVLTVAVLDCTGLSGTTVAEPVAYYNLFLTEPVGIWGNPPDNKSIYAEVIGPTNDPSFQEQIARRTIQLYQ